MKKKRIRRIPGQTKELTMDVHNSIVHGVSYGTYMALKLEKEKAKTK